MEPLVSKTLVYYDGPQVIECQNDLGWCYIGVRISDEAELFFLAAVSTERLSSFRARETDLLSLLLQPGSQQWWLGMLDGERIQFEREATPEPEYLPAPGLFLN